MPPSVAPRNVSLKQIDRDHFFHPYTALCTHAENGPIVVESGHGIFIRDSRGNEYIDGAATDNPARRDRRDGAQVAGVARRSTRRFAGVGPAGMTLPVDFAFLRIRRSNPNGARTRFSHGHGFAYSRCGGATIGARAQNDRSTG
jgi:hypothetical protein